MPRRTLELVDVTDLSDGTVSDGQFPLAELTSSCPDEPLRAHNRVDPYWHGLWSGESQASWVSREMVERFIDAGMSPVPRAKFWQPQVAKEMLQAGRLRAQRIDALAAINMWRTATDEQVASIIGRTPTPRRWHDLSILWNAGLVERGKPVTFQPKAKLPLLYRLSDPAAVDALLDEFGYDEWLSVTGGQQVQRGSQFDRHNIMATEFALRVAEFCDVPLVLGEQLAAHDLLRPVGKRKVEVGKAADRADIDRSGKVKKPKPKGRESGDVVIVRDDGLRIVVEMTAHARGTDKKIERWVELFGDTDFDSAGTVVVFVEMGRRDRSNNEFNLLRANVAKVLAAAPAATKRRLGERLAVARWQDWFPAARVATSGFVTLTADRPTGPFDARWQPAALLDPFEVVFDPPDPSVFTSVFGNARSLHGVPYWLRAGLDAAGGVGVDKSLLLRRAAGVPDSGIVAVPARHH